MRLLILGGTVFLGRHLVDAALTRGHEVTIFHRGRHPAHRPDEVLELLGDRDGGLDALVGRSWDAVIDTSGYVPRVVRAGAEALADATEHYTFVSSASVYADLSRVPVRESDPLQEPPDAQVEDPAGEHYGALKAGCERVVAEVFPDRALVQRAGLIVGPHDPTDRFTYWVRRMAAGGRALAPDARDAAVQVIDVRDMAAWTIDAVERQVAGTMNVIGPRGLTLAGLLELARRETGGTTEVVWVDEDAILAAGVAPWTGLPLWLPASFAAAGMFALDDTLVRAAGLRVRPLNDTIRDTHAWDRARGGGGRLDYGTRMGRAGLGADEEQDLLARLAPLDV